MDKNVILADYRCGCGIGVGRTDFLWLIDSENMLIEKDLAGVLVDANSEQTLAVQGRRG